MNWILRLSGIVFLTITLLPLLPTGKWYVRCWDFPRLQIAALLVIPLVIAVTKIFKPGLQWEPLVWASAIAIAIIWQVSHTIPFSPFWKTEVPTASGTTPAFKLLVSNLDFENPAPHDVVNQLEEEQADVLVLVEFDDRWKNSLAALQTQYPYRHEEIRSDGLGMAIWSQFPLEAAQTRHLVSERRASLWVRLRRKSGNAINLIALHPTPPGLLDSTGEDRRDSRVRDAELILVAKEVAERRDEPWIVAGDFNDVAWSHTTRLFKRTSGLLDPRIGRGLYNTYMADYPVFRFPIDHVFLSAGFSASSLARKRISGSDHFAVLITLSHQMPIGVQPEPQGNDHADQRELINEGQEDAATRRVGDEIETDIDGSEGPLSEKSPARQRYRTPTSRPGPAFG